VAGCPLSSNADDTDFADSFVTLISVMSQMAGDGRSAMRCDFERAEGRMKRRLLRV